MTKKKIYITLIFLLLFLVSYTAYTVLPLKASKYDVIQITGKQNIISSIASYVLIPLIESRIDFNLKNTGIITFLQKQKYDNKIISTEDIQIGKGKEVICGQDLIIKVGNKEKKIKVGQDNIKALNIGLIGMKEGGIRKIIVPKDYAERLTGEKDTKVEYEVTLQKVLSEYPDSVENLLKFETIIGNEKAVMCGDSVMLEYKVKNIKGEHVKTEKTSFKVGERQVPIAIELGVIEMVPGSKRTIISPPELLDENFSQEQVSIIDLSIN